MWSHILHKCVGILFFPHCARVYCINYSLLTWFSPVGSEGPGTHPSCCLLNVSLWNKMLNEHTVIAAGRRVLWSISHMNTWVGFYPELQLNVTSTVPLVKCLVVTIISPTWNCRREGQVCCATVQLFACVPDDNCGLFSWSLLMQYTVQTFPVSTKSTSEVTSCEITFRLKTQMCSDLCFHHRKSVLLSVCVYGCI